MPVKITQEDLDERQRQRLVNKIPKIRKETEEQGVVLNNIRYSGSISNRQALREALEGAESEGLKKFDTWKDSDHVFHKDHPVSDVKEALTKILQRRSVLIGLESKYIEQVLNGDVGNVDELDWTTEYD